MTAPRKRRKASPPPKSAAPTRARRTVKPPPATSPLAPVAGEVVETEGNGHGGARDGAGRPRSSLPPELIGQLGPPPADPLDTAEWYRKAIGYVQRGVLEGQPWRELLRDLHKSAKVCQEMAKAEIEAALARAKLKPAATDDAGAAKTTRKEDPHAGHRSGAVRSNPR